MPSTSVIIIEDRNECWISFWAEAPEDVVFFLWYSFQDSDMEVLLTIIADNVERRVIILNYPINRWAAKERERIAGIIQGLHFNMRQQSLGGKGIFQAVV